MTIQMKAILGYQVILKEAFNLDAAQPAQK